MGRFCQGWLFDGILGRKGLKSVSFHCACSRRHLTRAAPLAGKRQHTGDPTRGGTLGCVYLLWAFCPVKRHNALFSLTVFASQNTAE
jgi:hypothetical protein